MPEPGGAAITSGGGCLIVGSPLQKARGIHDTPDLAFDDWVKWGGDFVDEVWALLHRAHAARPLSLGRAQRREVGRPEVPGRQFRAALDARGDEWLGLMTKLIASYRAKGGEIVTDTEVTKLTRSGGRITGFEAKNAKTGEAFSVGAKSVVVTSGGFNSNLDMVLEARPDLKGERVMEGSGRGATGSGHKLVRAVGGYLTRLDHIWFYMYATPDYRDPGGRRGLVFLVVPGYVWVTQGRRFHNEAMSGGATASPALLAQKPRHAWAIMDRTMASGMEVADPYYRNGDKPNRSGSRSSCTPRRSCAARIR